MHEIDRLFELYKLKEVYRKTEISKRNESTAEHIYSSLILAQYFLKKVKGLNENKVMKLILYHDLCEIYAKDTFTLERTNETDKKEQKAIEKLSKIIPQELSKEILEYHKEYVEQKTIEAKFARAIDVLDPTINEMHNHKLWKKYNFTESVLRSMKEPYVNEFKETKEFFEDIVIEFKKRKLIIEEE